MDGAAGLGGATGLDSVAAIGDLRGGEVGNGEREHGVRECRNDRSEQRDRFFGDEAQMALARPQWQSENGFSRRGF